MPRTIFLMLVVAPLLATGCAARQPTSSGGPASPPATMSAARAALASGHLIEAVEMYERLATEARRGEDRTEAMERAAFLRATEHSGLRDFDRARHWIALRRTQGGRHDRLMEMNALEAVVLELEQSSRALREQTGGHTDAMPPSASRVDGPSGAGAPSPSSSPARQRDEDVRALKASNASLQAEIAKLRAELRQKEEALRK
ncbi:MAG: hypothetical protein KJ061_12960, partial [Vicinamibacteraceae bacterium]|nr:hypothetical protein [Vicinamibacteraceae bacterium]